MLRCHTRATDLPNRSPDAHAEGDGDVTPTLISGPEEDCQSEQGPAPEAPHVDVQPPLPSRPGTRRRPTKSGPLVITPIAAPSVHPPSPVMEQAADDDDDDDDDDSVRESLENSGVASTTGSSSASGQRATSVLSYQTSMPLVRVINLWYELVAHCVPDPR